MTRTGFPVIISNQPQNNHKTTTKHQQNINPIIGSCRRESTVLFRRLIASFPSMLCLSPASKCRQQCHRKLDMRRIAGLLSLDGRPQAMYVFIFFPLTMGSSPCELSTPRRWKTWNWMGQRPTKQVKFIGMWRGKVGRRSPGFLTHGDFVSTFIANRSYSVNQIVLLHFITTRSVIHQTKIDTKTGSLLPCTFQFELVWVYWCDTWQ